MARFSATFKVLGLLLMIFSISMLPPMFVSWWYHDGSEFSFVLALLITIFTGFIFWFPFRNHHQELKIRDGFLVVVLLWTVLSIFGAIPIYIDLYPKLSVVDAVFESTSGLTTTGATVLIHLDKLPNAVLYYRQQLHLLGGMGIIVLAVAILPMLGIGGMQLYRAETVGPIKTNKLRPRMAQTAKALWSIYVGLVVVCALAYWLAGMRLFDAIGESFTTVATGGFSLHDASFGYYHSVPIDIIAIVFMLLGATNFGLHYQMIRHRRFLFLKDPEFKAYLKLLLSVTLVATIALFIYHQSHRWMTILHALFTTVSLGTTTGLTTDDFSIWPSFLPFMIMFLAMIGGCGGSTSGGLKVIRVLLLKEQGKRELKQLIHPQAIYQMRLGNVELPEHVVQAIWGFVAVFSVLFIFFLLLLMMLGLDIKTAFGAAAACLSNSGASIGKVATTYEGIPSSAKWALLFAMIAGRLEIFTLLVLFTPAYWRK